MVRLSSNHTLAVMLGSLLVIFTTAAVAEDKPAAKAGNALPGNEELDKSLFDKPLFDKPLFDDNKSIFDSEPGAAKQSGKGGDYDVSSGQPSDVQKHIDDRLNSSYQDQRMRDQINQVAQWLSSYGIRNQGLFPGVYGDRQQAAQVQLTELVPDNPYADDSGAVSGLQGLDTPTQGLSSTLPGNAQTGGPVWSDNYNNSFNGAQLMDRVRLSMNWGMTPNDVDAWRASPPDDWDGPPGTIFALGNNQGLIVVWGSGRDGRPLKDTGGKKVFIVVGRAWGLQSDQNAPNEK